MTRPVTRSTLRRPVLAAACGLLASLLAGCSSGGPDGSASSSDGSVTAAPATCSTSVAPGLNGAAVPFGTHATTGSSSALQVSSGRPMATTVPSGHAGYRLVEVPITADVRTNGTFAVDRSQFVLVGPDNRLCTQPKINPLAGGFVALTVDEAHPGSGVVAFLVPASVSTTQLSVRYLPATGAPSASLAWRSDATAPPTPEVTNACDGAKSTYRATGVHSVSFGSSVEHGDSVVSSTVRASTPTRRAFEPGPSQPNNMDAIDVKLHVTASGADAYVDRLAFVLVDGTGRLCRRAAVSSQGETLSSALVKKGHSANYTIVFWAPKDSTIKGLRLLQLTKPSGKKVGSIWSAPKLTLSPTD
ncbi:hypothetical protein [Flexivirga oryzae]|uniref:PKD domain-containing protein n=1 Tax=Flexivirga oryzae TaxID=1794944 RepID=A0A839MY04_9MICO|nr:hypothetical protein [Flexivirga oryzae]MBB2890320.1 hypothetical protein [Flexivirga oryzae]